jgi:hypothetical protein
MTTALDFDLFNTAVVPPATPATPVARPVGRDSSAHIGKPESEWDWHDLRDYAMVEMERCHGPQVRDAAKERSIFGAFIKRHGPTDSAAIVRYAFGFCKGMWNNAPISVNRFCKASDQYFAEPIKQRLLV